jgi:hypothetical protein
LECPETSDSEWNSTDEEDEEEENKEVYARKRTREGGRSNKKETRASKAQRRETNELPPKMRDTKPVLHPLTDEEKRKRAETRKHNRELQQEQNGGIIQVLLMDCLPGLVTHKHISHFRTDLHRHIDKVMFFDREQYKAKRAGKGTPEKGKGNARMETNSLEVEQPKVARPLYSDERIPEAKPATPGDSSASEQVQPPKGSAKENYAVDSISDSRFMSFEVIGKSLACRTHAGRCRRHYIL